MEANPKLRDGALADVVININSEYLKSDCWLDPNPAAGSVPSDKYDMVSVLAHEFGHGLGIGSISSLDTTTGTFDDKQKKTSWESLLDIQKSGTYFTGSHAEKEHGGPVVVTTNTPGENYSHLGNARSDVDDPHTGDPDVMYGVLLYEGDRYVVSDLDVAILQDLGYHTKLPVLSVPPIQKDIDISEIIHSLDDASPTHTTAGNIISEIANAAGDASPTHTTAGNIIGEIANAVANAAGDASPTHTTAGNINSEIANAVANAAGDASPTHTTAGNIISEIANAVANAAGSSGSHTTGSFWDQAAAAVSTQGLTQIADQLSHLSSGAHSDISALTAVVAPTVLADAHIADPQLDIAHIISDFAHQLHI
jgi:hypothetical protein